MTQHATEENAWDAYGDGRQARLWDRDPIRFHWTQWTGHPNHGPQLELLPTGPGTSVLDLGCGKGRNLSHVAARGGRAVGVDLSGNQITAARALSGVGMELHQADAAAFLDTCREEFGAVWFTDPEVLLPKIWRRLKPGGVLVFSHRPPENGEYGAVLHGEEAPATRWCYPDAVWEGHLRAVGFVDVASWIIAPPPGKEGMVQTVIVRGTRSTTAQGSP
ncbi:class I SAM-dependent methyltransferase [Streptomyces sp. NPDC001663]|uniref:class I SAM-dependent methyltransferase n=1 Tax=Streptomyces sp. NPDC001663 TaxID=3364597 RepID=UPI003697BECC